MGSVCSGSRPVIGVVLTAVLMVSAMAVPASAAPAVGEGSAQPEAFRRAQAEVGGRDAVGDPTSTVHGYGNGCIQDMAGGYLSPASLGQAECTGRAHAITGAHLLFWIDVAGGPDGIGYPDQGNDGASHRYGNGWTQDFRGGRQGWTLVMYGDNTGRAHGLSGGIRDHYFALDGVHALGYPTTNEYGWNGETRQDFERGSIIWNATDGARRLGRFAVGQGSAEPERFRVAYRQVGGRDAVGDADSDVHGWGSGCIQDLTGGRLTPAALLQAGCAGRAHAVTGAHLQYLLDVGGPDEIGYPDQGDAGASHRYGDGWTQDFRGGRRGWTLVSLADGAARARGVHGGIRDFWFAQGGADGRYGLPTSDEENVGSYRRQLFQRGAIGWSSGSGAFDWDTGHPEAPGKPTAPDPGSSAVGRGASDPMPWIEAASTSGGRAVLGTPINDVHDWWGGCIQDFSGGSQHRSGLMQPDCQGTVHVVSGAIWQFLERRHEGGQGPRWLGYPTANAAYSSALGGWTQQFRGGENGYTEVRLGDAVGTAWGVTAPILDVLVHERAEIGWPVSGPYRWGGELRQDFESGSVFHNSTSGGRVERIDNAPPVIPPEPPPCVDVLFLGARGSGQASDDADGLGDEVDVAWQRTRAAADGIGRSSARIAISYPAKSVWWLWHPSYYDGQEAGTVNMVEVLKERLEPCPDERIVLSGFSQGAMSVEEGLHDLAGNDPHGFLDRIDAVLLIASPRARATNSYSRGSYHPRGDGVAVALETLPESLWGRTISWCNDGDGVCEMLPAGHAGYVDDGRMARAFEAQVRWGLHVRAGLGPRPSGGIVTAAARQVVDSPSLSGARHTFSAGSSTSTAAPITSFEWDFDGDGTFETATDGPYLSRVFGDGPLTPTLRVTDAIGNSAVVQVPAAGAAEQTPVPPDATLASLAPSGLIEVGWSNTAFAGPSDPGSELLDIRVVKDGVETTIAVAPSAAGSLRIDASELELRPGDQVSVGVPGRSSDDAEQVSTTNLRTGDVQPLDRVAGADRIATAIAVAARVSPARSRTVVMASADSPADALAAVPLAAELAAPLLLVGDYVSDALSAELQRLAPREIVVVGGPAAIAHRVEDDLVQHAPVRRLGGSSRVETAALIARSLAAFDRAVVVQGYGQGSWADAVSAGALAARQGGPVLLVGDRLDDTTAEILSAINEVTIVGGTSAVSAALEREIGATVPLVGRLGGATRWETAALSARRALDRGADPRRVIAATASSFPDALTAGPLAASRDGVLLLAGGPPSAYMALAGSGIEQSTLVTVVGGPAAVPDDSAEQLHHILVDLHDEGDSPAPPEDEPPPVDGGPAPPAAPPVDGSDAPGDGRGPSSTEVAVMGRVPGAGMSIVAVASGPDDLWALVDNDAPPGVWRIDPATNRVTEIVPLPDAFVPRGIAWAGGKVWVSDARGGLWRIASASGVVEWLPLSQADSLEELVVADGRLYAADDQSGLLLEVDPVMESVSRAWQLPDPIWHLAVGDGWAYTLLSDADGEDRVFGFDLDTATGVEIDPAGDLDVLMDVDVAGGRVLVSGWRYPEPGNYSADTVLWSSGIGDPSLVPTLINHVACPEALWADGSTTWVVDGCDGTLEAMTGSSFSPVTSIQLDQDPRSWSGGLTSVVPGFASVWVLTSVVDPQYLYRVG